MAEMAKKLGGAERAAVLLVSLGEEVAAEILRHMGPKEVQRVGSTIATLKDVGTEQVDGVLEDFLESIGRHTSLGVDSENYLRKTLMQALGEDKAGAVIDRILLGGNVHGLESLKWMEARTVAEMIRLEHPQIIAIILAYLDGDQAAGVLSQLDEKTRVDVLMRVATLDAVQPAALAELNAILERQIAGSANVQSANVGGAKVAAEILNFVDTSIEAELMEGVLGEPAARPQGGGRVDEGEVLQEHVEACRGNDARRSRGQGTGAGERGRERAEGDRQHRAPARGRRSAGARDQGWSGGVRLMRGVTPGGGSLRRKHR
jgi:flagellar motor switch protein FliG